MSHPAWLPQVPKWVGQAVLWLVLYGAVGSWFGFVTPPWEKAKEDRAALSAVTTRAQQSEQAVYMLQWQMQQVQADLAEMKMVLYSMERRGR